MTKNLIILNLGFFMKQNSYQFEEGFPQTGYIELSRPGTILGKNDKKW